MTVQGSSNDQWLVALRGPTKDEALAELRVVLMRGLKAALGGQASRVESSVEDFVQEALIKILDNLDSFRGECRFTTWAQKICVRTAFAEILTERQRTAVLAALGGMPLEAVADRMNTNRNALYKLLHEARKWLRLRMSAEMLSPQDMLGAFGEG